MTRQTAWLVAAAAIALGLVGVYALAGGTDYKPDASPDPCAPYHWPHGVSGATAITEQVGLSALAGAACDLGVSREELTLAFADQGRLDAFEKKHGFSRAASTRPPAPASTAPSTRASRPARSTRWRRSCCTRRSGWPRSTS